MTPATSRVLQIYAVSVHLVFPAAVYGSMLFSSPQNGAGGVILIAIPFMTAVMLAIAVPLSRLTACGSRLAGGVLALFLAAETILWWHDGVTYEYDGPTADDRLSLMVAALHAVAVAGVIAITLASHPPKPGGRARGR